MSPSLFGAIISGSVRNESPATVSRAESRIGLSVLLAQAMRSTPRELMVTSLRLRRNPPIRLGRGDQLSRLSTSPTRVRRREGYVLSNSVYSSMLYLKLLLRPLGSKFATTSTLPLGSMAVGDVATFKHPHDERNWVMTTLLLEVLRTRYRTSTTLSSEIVPTFTTPS